MKYFKFNFSLYPNVKHCFSQINQLYSFRLDFLIYFISVTFLSIFCFLFFFFSQAQFFAQSFWDKKSLNPKWNAICGKLDLHFRVEGAQSSVYTLLFQEKFMDGAFTIFAKSWGSAVQLFKRNTILFRRLTVKYKMG